MRIFFAIQKSPSHSLESQNRIYNYIADYYVVDRKIQSRYRRRRVTTAGQTADSFRNLCHVSGIETRRQLSIKESY